MIIAKTAHRFISVVINPAVFADQAADRELLLTNGDGYWLQQRLNWQFIVIG